MRDVVRAYIEKYRLLTENRPVLVGVSGGADSIALLSILVESGYSCIAAHCNFHLRGDESLRDEQFVREYARKLDVPFLMTDFDTRKYAADRYLSIEMAARELRYGWFEEQRAATGAQAVAVAHHRDDSVETLLMNLVRGTGIRGMSGIRPRNGFVVRPLLAVILIAGNLQNPPSDQFSFSSGIRCNDNCSHIFAKQMILHNLKLSVCLLNHYKLKMLRHHRKIFCIPCLVLRIISFRVC